MTSPGTIHDYARRMLAPFIVPVHPLGTVWLLAVGGLALLCWLTGATLAPMLAIATLFLYLSFRNPVRVPPLATHAIIAPADGIITAIDTAALPVITDLMTSRIETRRIVITTGVFDAHILRAPLAGAITHQTYHAGSWGSNVLDAAAADNERAVIGCKPANAADMVLMTVTCGLLPKRITVTAELGTAVMGGDTIGLASFGAEIAVYLPADYDITARVGQRMIAGETVLATPIAQPAAEAVTTTSTAPVL